MADKPELLSEVQHIDWEPFLAERAQRMQSSIIRELLKLTLQPDVISFAGGLPAPEFFPLREFEEAAHHVLQTVGAQALQYSTTEGHPELRIWLAEYMAKYGIKVETGNVILTNGSQQALDLIGKLFIEPGTCIMCSAPTYLGALQAWNAYQADYITVPQDDHGMLVDQIPEIIKNRSSGKCPHLLYVLPNFHNPAGTTLPLDRREKLVEIAREHELILVEDDPYGELRYEGEDVTPLFRMAPERTIYLSTFSKTLAPGIRLGWVVAPKSIINRFVQAKQGADLHTGTLVQMMANDICQRGILKQHVKNLRKVYKDRRDVMLEELDKNFPEGCYWTRPLGGLFLWAQVPESVNTRELLPKAVEHKVAFVPGFCFYPYEQGGDHAMRLNFSNATEENIRVGMRRLGDAIKAEM